MFTKQTPLPPQQPRGFLERVINTAGIGAPRPPARGNNQAVANRWMAAQANQRRRMRQEQARQWQENVRAGIAPPGTTRAPEAPAEGIWVSPQGVEIEDNGVRTIDPHYRELLDDEIKEIYNIWVPYSKQVKLSGSTDDRIKTVLQTVFP